MEKRNQRFKWLVAIFVSILEKDLKAHIILLLTGLNHMIKSMIFIWTMINDIEHMQTLCNKSIEVNHGPERKNRSINVSKNNEVLYSVPCYFCTVGVLGRNLAMPNCTNIGQIIRSVSVAWFQCVWIGQWKQACWTKVLDFARVQRPDT